MEARNTTPSFTTAIRGYDREEVDEYVDSLAKAMEDLEEAEEQNRRLQSHLSRLNARIHELEDRIKTETPLTAGALGERITLVLTEAEAGASRTLEQAEAKAASRIEEAEAKARALETEAHNKQAALVADAERRAKARTRQVEEWEQQVVAHTHAQQAYQARVHKETEEAHQARMADLAAEHEAAITALRDVRETVDRLLRRVASSPAATRMKPDAGATRPAPDATVHDAPPHDGPARDETGDDASDAEAETPASGSHAEADDAGDWNVRTSEHPAVHADEAFEEMADEGEPAGNAATRVDGSMEPMTAHFRAVS